MDRGGMAQEHPKKSGRRVNMSVSMIGTESKTLYTYVNVWCTFVHVYVHAHVYVDADVDVNILHILMPHAPPRPPPCLIVWDSVWVNVFLEGCSRAPSLSWARQSLASFRQTIDLPSGVGLGWRRGRRKRKRKTKRKRKRREREKEKEIEQEMREKMKSMRRERIEEEEE